MKTIDKIGQAFDLLVDVKNDIEEMGYAESNPMYSKLDTLCGKLDNYIMEYTSKLEDK